jgi:hypothetical protein
MVKVYEGKKMAFSGKYLYISISMTILPKTAKKCPPYTL